MANRRKFIAGLGALATGSAAAMGTGAFSSVSANRSVTISTAADSNALLAFEARSGNVNSEYASVDSNEATVDFSDTNTDEGGLGVNENSLTRIYDIFTIENQGTQDAFVYADPSTLKDDDAFDDSVDNLYLDPQFSDMPNNGDSSLGTLGDGTKFGSLSGIGGSVDDFKSDVRDPNSKVPYSPDTFVLSPGQSFDFGLYIKTTGEVNAVDIDMTIIGDAELAKQIESDD